MTSLLDRALDAAVVPGFTNVGHALRRRTWDPAELQRLDGRVVAVTGATSGIGRAAAQELARLGAGVRLVVRDVQRGEQVRAELVRETGNDDVAVVLCDLADLADVRRCAADLVEHEPRLDVLVHNAGVLPATHVRTVDGLELAFATNVAGPFLLTELLLPLLRRSAPARVITVSSGGMYAQRLRVGELQVPADGFDGTTAYARTKRAQVVLTELWSERLARTGVAFHAMHPGWADTPGVRTSLPRFHRVTRPLLRTPQQGADTIVWLAAVAPGPPGGGFWHDRRRRPTHRVPWTREAGSERAALWDLCTRVVQPARAEVVPAPVRAA